MITFALVIGGTAFVGVTGCLFVIYALRCDLVRLERDMKDERSERWRQGHRIDHLHKRLTTIGKVFASIHKDEEQ